LRHAANSAGAIAHPAARYDLVRCGIAVYGIAPSPSLAGQVLLRPAMSLSARVTQVKTVAAGEAISYGLRHRFDHDATVATVSIGYADGVRRDLHQRGGEVLLDGRRCPIVGTVTMDQIMVDCTGVAVRVGDEAVLVGSQGGERITAEEVADHLDTIGYEVVCGVGPRVERRWTGC
jgi:alanine racemase